jgi:hypothetical protein
MRGGGFSQTVSKYVSTCLFLALMSYNEEADFTLVSLLKLSGWHECPAAGTVHVIVTGLVCLDL